MAHAVPDHRWNDVLSRERHARELDRRRDVLVASIPPTAIGGLARSAVYEIFPERAAFVRQGKPERPSVAHPLDDGSFLYFLRTVPLEVGATYEFHRYFIPDRNPVRLDVLRTEAIEVPAGRYDALLIRPVIKTQGVFSEGGRAQVWVSNDADHLLLQMTSHLKFGSLTLQLRSRTVRTPADATSRSEPEHR